jgi:hypothetical protein
MPHIISFQYFASSIRDWLFGFLRVSVLFGVDFPCQTASIHFLLLIVSNGAISPVGQFGQSELAGG